MQAKRKERTAGFKKASTSRRMPGQTQEDVVGVGADGDLTVPNVPVEEGEGVEEVEALDRLIVNISEVQSLSVAREP